MSHTDYFGICSFTYKLCSLAKVLVLSGDLRMFLEELDKIIYAKSSMPWNCKTVATPCISAISLTCHVWYYCSREVKWLLQSHTNICR